MMFANTTGRTIGIVFSALILLTLAIAPVSAQAEGPDFGSTGWYVDSYTDSYPASYDYGYDSTGWYVDSYTDSYPASYSYDYYTPSYSYGGGYSYYTPSYGGGSYGYSSSVSSVYAPSNTEVCNAPNSCNDNSVFNAPTVVTVTDYDNDNDKKHYDKKKKRDYDRDYDYRKVSYQAPYVSLSQVPYTGLELGPMGTALYWSFLVLWCLVAAYLIVVKRVQNTLLSKLNVFLFGEPGATRSTGAGLSEREIEHYASMLRSSAKKHEVAKSEDETDEFVLSQINRSRN